MVAHQRLTAATGVKVYFADSHSPWERGINENTNGLLRLAGQCGTVLEDMALMGFIASFRCWVSESQPSVFPGRARFQPVSRGDSCPQPLSHQLHPSAHFSFALRCSVSGYSRFKVTARSRLYSVPVIPGWFVKVSNSEQ